MKKLLSLCSAAALFGTLLITSCAKEDPEPTTPPGTDPRANFRGYWYVEEDSKDFGPSTYYTTISDSSNASYIQIAYLYGFNKKTYATVSGNNITIPKQTIQGNEISGTGILKNINRIELDYLVKTTGTHYDTVSAVLTK